MAEPPVAPPSKRGQTATKLQEKRQSDQKRSGSVPPLDRSKKKVNRKLTEAPIVAESEKAIDREDVAGLNPPSEMDPKKLEEEEKLKSDQSSATKIDPINTTNDHSAPVTDPINTIPVVEKLETEIPEKLRDELKEILVLSKEKESEGRNIAILEAIRKINAQLEIGERSETEVELESQSSVVPIQIGNLNFQIETCKLDEMIARSRNNGGSVEELLADYFVSKVANIIEGKEVETDKELDHNVAKLEMAFKEKLIAKVKTEKESLINPKGVSFAAAPGNASEARGNQSENEKGKDKEKQETPSNVASVSGVKQAEETVVKTKVAEACRPPVWENAKPRNESKAPIRPQERGNNATRGRAENRGGMEGRRNNSLSAGPGDRQRKQAWGHTQRFPGSQGQTTNMQTQQKRETDIRKDGKGGQAAAKDHYYEVLRELSKEEEEKDKLEKGEWDPGEGMEEEESESEEEKSDDDDDFSLSMESSDDERSSQERVNEVEEGTKKEYQEANITPPTRVNCLASCLANRAEGEDVIWIGGALPRGFQNLVALEGIPHFSYLPGCDLS
nr:hypothetical protein Iba_chr06cCG18070 [Ipomoea batatas]